jgi:hypothetical protein
MLRGNNLATNFMNFTKFLLCGIGEICSCLKNVEYVREFIVIREIMARYLTKTGDRN